MSTGLWGAAIQIAPIRVFFNPNQTIETLKITNQDSVPVILQLDIKNWQQNEKGEDLHTPTTDLLVIPALFTLSAGQTQIVRVAILKKEKLPLTSEKAYRLMLREVPGSTIENGQAPQLNMAIQMALPVFIGSQTNNQAQYKSSVLNKINNRTLMNISNVGAQHFLVTGVTIFDVNNQLIYEKNGLFSYVFPGISKTISLETNINIPHDAKIVLKANS